MIHEYLIAKFTYNFAEELASVSEIDFAAWMLVDCFDEQSLLYWDVYTIAGITVIALDACKHIAMFSLFLMSYMFQVRDILE